MSFGVHPFVLIAAVGVLAALIAIVIACCARSGLVTVLMVFLAVLFVAPTGYLFLGFYPQLVDGRFRTYKAFYGDIQVGMTREQVLAVMEKRYPPDGRRKRPEIMDNTPQSLGSS